MKINSKKIKFNPTSEMAQISVSSPKPSKNFIPDWYKNMPAFQTKKPLFSKELGTSNRTLKHCMPFADSFQMGYIQETWQDIHFENKILDNKTREFNYYHPTSPDIVGIRNQENYNYPIPEEFYQFELSWHPAWIPELPKGYSAIITHPFNRQDLPFLTLTGILDSDTFTQSMENSNYPFLLKNNFNGMIPKGTPMYQIIPFKREDWNSAINIFDSIKQKKEVQKIRQYFWSGYKKVHWVKKKFE